jgi:hypothetical protein
LKAESAYAQRGADFRECLENIEAILIDGSRTSVVIVIERRLKLSKELQFPTGGKFGSVRTT